MERLRQKLPKSNKPEYSKTHTAVKESVYRDMVMWINKVGYIDNNRAKHLFNMSGSFPISTFKFWGHVSWLPDNIMFEVLSYGLQSLMAHGISAETAIPYRKFFSRMTGSKRIDFLEYHADRMFKDGFSDVRIDYGHVIPVNIDDPTIGSVL